jgi:flagellar basal-body rod protein FlgF
MSHELYTSLSGACAAWAQLDTVANNLANTRTTGFKADRLVFSDGGVGAGPLGRPYAMVAETVSDHSDGSLETDGVETHLAIQGRGFFVIDGGDLTRDGRFHIDQAQRLVTAEGLAVAGDSGPIVVPIGETITVGQDGTVAGSVTGQIGRILVVDGPARPIGAGRWRAEGPLMQADAKVVQGTLEQSNVDPLRAMVDLVQASRAFEMFQKAMQATDDLDGRLYSGGGGR